MRQGRGRYDRSALTTGSPTSPSPTRLPPSPRPLPALPPPALSPAPNPPGGRPARRAERRRRSRGPARLRRSERRSCRRGCACPAPLAPPACRRARSFRGRFDGLVTCAGAPKQLDGESSTTAHRLGRDKRASAIQANKARPQSEAKEPLAPARGRRPSSTSAGRTLFRDSAPR